MLTSSKGNPTTRHLGIWRVGAVCALWLLAIALLLSGVEGLWLWIAFGAAMVATSFGKARGGGGGSGGGDGDGSSGGWFGDGGWSGGDGGGGWGGGDGGQ